MKTAIFASYSEFYARTDKTQNGVSPSFSELHADYEKQNVTNEGCWNCSRCSGCSRCSDCSGCSDCSDCSDCSGCSGCSDCSDCSGCSDCSDCSDCSRCSDCSGCSRCSDCSGCSGCSHLASLDGRKNLSPPGVGPAEPGKSWFDVPTIPNIHRTLLAAVKAPDHKLNMSDWHTCDTTHCRAGWVVFLAGEKGRKLELASSTLFAAQQIYKASSPLRVSPVRFFEKNEVAMADIERCAEEEAKATPQL